MCKLQARSVYWFAAILVGLTSSATGAETKVKPISAKKPEPVFRHENYSSAWHASKKSNRPILIYVSMPSCPHCVKMIEETYARTDVRELVGDSFETVELDRHRDAEIVGKLRVKWYPTTILVGANNKVLAKLEGYVEHDAFKQQIKTNLAGVETPTATR